MVTSVAKEPRVPGDREYELKFSIDPAACEALVSHPALTSALSGRQLSHLTSTYFDTPDERLRRARISLRVRTTEGGAVQTLKQATSSIVDRAEWERPVAGARPDAAFLRDTPLRPLFDEIDGALTPRFTVDVTRITFPLHRGAADIEAALDRGTIRADGRALEVSELELESKQGAPEAVFAMARDLVRDLPLTLSLASKSERGFAVAGLTWGRPIKALDLALTKKMTRAEAFGAIVQACLAAITWNAALIVQKGSDAAAGEAVHKTRIALRRLRAALDLFAPALRPRRLAALERDVKWAARKLGAARDADVLRVEHLEPATRDPLVTGAPALLALMGEDRGRAHARLRAALASSRWRLMLVELLAFSLDGVRRRQRRRGYRGFVRRRLAAHHRGLVRQARRFARLKPEALHDLRKSGKMLRYDLEMVGTVPRLGTGKGRARLLADLEHLQETLGAVQDGTAATAHLRGAILDRRRPRAISPETWRSATSAARLLTRHTSDGAARMRKAGKVAKRLRRKVAFA